MTFCEVQKCARFDWRTLALEGSPSEQVLSNTES
jgi:hypothetical protein